MAIHIPTLDELSAEQKKILFEMELDENSLVMGPPGTGKTVMAMLRARQVVDGTGETATLIMYNRVLVAYSNSYGGGEFQKKVDVRTYDSWTWKLWNVRINGYPPSIEGTDGYGYDWTEMSNRLNKEKVSVGHLLIDEGQDLPPDLYHTLGMLTERDGSSVCVVADENQKLKRSEHSSIKDIRDKLGAFQDLKEAKLSRNYRNSRPIAELARKFYVGLESGIPDLPEGSDSEGSDPQIQPCGNLNEMIERISNYAKNNPTHSILVIGAKPSSVRKYFNRLTSRLPSMTIEGYIKKAYLHCRTCNGKGKVEGGTPSGRSSRGNQCPRCKSGKDMLHTSDPGVITCCHDKSMKGLEADAVFIPNFEDHAHGGDDTVFEKMKFYVMFSRARRYLEIQYLQSPQVEQSPVLRLIRDQNGMGNPDVKDKLAEQGALFGTQQNLDRPARDCANAVVQAKKKVKSVFADFERAAKRIPSYEDYKSREAMKDSINRYNKQNPHHQILVVDDVEFDGDFSSEKIRCVRSADLRGVSLEPDPDAVFISMEDEPSAGFDPLELTGPMNFLGNPPDYFEVQILDN